MIFLIQNPMFALDIFCIYHHKGLYLVSKDHLLSNSSANIQDLV